MTDTVLYRQADEDVKAIIRQLVSDVIGIQPQDVSMDNSLCELGADSFHIADLAFRLEQHFAMRIISPSAAENFHTVTSLAIIVIRVTGSKQ